MSGLAAIPARILVDELVRRHGPEKAARMLGLSNEGELLTVTAELDSLRSPEAN
ncbi:hypothetical protein QYF68_09990 [Mycolicibacterium austroafricanum]|uniref:Uncharacterized protein n=1 Tax=Mycolicibacterium austroafricanum TaxID=39687 RepID=A0ABT8HBL4_MYCAO|nr:hypothetical protein [Mycolicibacterium austroafricanum]MDN4518155.1 hypothetical protein [Mycolicibacterium austroafricanum]